MAGRVFVTGAAGFVGTAVVNELVARRYAVNALVNHRSIREQPGVSGFLGDLFEPASLDLGMRGCSCGDSSRRHHHGETLERHHVRADSLRKDECVVDAAKRNGITRYIHMSALGTRPDARSNYHKTKFAAEEYVR